MVVPAGEVEISREKKTVPVPPTVRGFSGSFSDVPVPRGGTARKKSFPVHPPQIHRPKSTLTPRKTLKNINN